MTVFTVHEPRPRKNETVVDPDQERLIERLLNGQETAINNFGTTAVQVKNPSAAVLYTIGAMHGIETLCLVAISDLLTDDGSERIGDAELRAAVDSMMRVGCEIAVA